MTRSQRRGADDDGRYSRRALLQRALLATAGVAALGLPAGARDPAPAGADDAARTLADLLPTLAWDPVSRGPLLVVGADTTRRLPTDDGARLVSLPEPTSDGRRNLSQTLPAFGRELVPVGTLTVVAPTEMTRIDDTLRAPPHLWDELSGPQRMLTLLSTLSADQWSRVGSPQGLGAGDLTTGDQRAAFDSLLPDPFGVEKVHVTPTGGEQTLSSTILNGDDRGQVRLRLQLTLFFEISLLNIPGAQAASFNTANPYGAPGTTITRLSANPSPSPDDRADAYAVPIRTVAPNRSKPADLAYDTPVLARETPLRGQETVSELVERIGAASGIELYADYRVGLLIVTARGEQAQAGDILKALALAVTGTWRHVHGNCFLLVSDLVGAGSRKLKLAEWQADLEQDADDAQSDAAGTIAKSGYFAKYVSFAADDPLAPPPDLAASIIAVEGTGAMYDRDNLHPVASLPRPLQDYLNDNFARAGRRAQNWDQQHVAAERHLSARFVLPDGTVVPAMDIVPAWFIRDGSHRTQDDIDKDILAFAARTPLAGPFVLAPQAQYRFLFLAASTVQEAADALHTARRYGFDAIGIVSNDAAVIRAAVAEARSASGAVASEAASRTAAASKRARMPIDVWAVVCPFAAPANASYDDLDRNLLGQTWDQIVAARKTSSHFAAYLTQVRSNGAPQLTTEWLTEPGVLSIAPGTDAIAPLAAIAAVDGLAGLIVTCTAPPGYVGTAPSVGWGPQRVGGALGYAPALRATFVGAERVDPIDLIPDGVEFAVDVSQPFFPDARAHAGRSMYAAGDRLESELAGRLRRWYAFRQKEYRTALAAFYAEFRKQRPNLPLYVGAQPPPGNSQEPFWFASPIFVPWNSLDNVPTWTDALAKDPMAITPIRISRPEKEYTGFLLRVEMQQLAADPLSSGRAAIDLSSMSLGDAQELLARWVIPQSGM
jgi:hypothetical protein